MNLGAAQIRQAGGPAVVTFPAEVDLSNGDDLLDEALRLLRSRAPALIFDLGKCSFCDSSGPNAIFRAQLRADRMGVPMIVVLPARGIVHKICDIAGVTRRVAIAPDLETAFALLSASAARPGPRAPFAPPPPAGPATSPPHARAPFGVRR